VKQLKVRLTHWVGDSKNYGLQKKSEKGSNGKAVKKGRKNTIMKINEREIKQVNRFTCLKSVVEKIDEIQKEIKERIRKDSQFYHSLNSIICNKDTDRKCKTTTYKVYVKKILLYVGDTMTCNKKDKSKKQATVMKLLMAIMGKTNSNRIRNAYITEELRMEDIQNQTQGNRFKRFGYVKRMVEHKNQNHYCK
jgi:hypothetical protein